MFTKTLMLDTVDKVKLFTEAICSFKYPADISSGRYLVNARSIMGILSLDLTKPVILQVHDESREITEADAADFLQTIKDFIV